MGMRIQQTRPVRVAMQSKSISSFLQHAQPPKPSDSSWISHRHINQVSDSGVAIFFKKMLIAAVLLEVITQIRIARRDLCSSIKVFDMFGDHLFSDFVIFRLLVQHHYNHDEKNIDNDFSFGTLSLSLSRPSSPTISLKSKLIELRYRLARCH